MADTSFYFDGESSKSGVRVDTSSIPDISGLKQVISNHLGVVQPEGLSFHHADTDEELTDISAVKAYNSTVKMKVDGHAVRDVPGPTQLPFVGNWFEVYPDQLGNNQRLFEKYGPIFQTNTMGAVNYFTNDPELTQIGFSETEFFSKEIRQGHPLYPIKNNLAGVFLGDTSNPSWNIVHKFLPPALGPKAVRHYAPTMNGCLDESLPIFDELEENGDAWNVYQYMLKLSSGTVGKIMLGKDLEHFKSVDAPLHPLVVAIAEQLAVNKKVTSKGEWFKYLPFVGDTAKMKSLQSDVHKQVEQLMGEAKLSGDESLPLQDAALKANNVIDYLVRATDSNGVRLPKENLLSAVLVASGAGFTTTSSLLSWCIFGLATYAGTQARLLQELVDHDITDASNITADQIDELPELDKFIKEMQRRHNPSYQPGRTALRDMVLPGGYKLKEGSVLILALHHLHTNSKIWENPDKFDPDRWDTDAVKHRHKAAYVPFATGQRMCIGFNFALLEVKIFICKLVWRYHWEKEGEAETEYDPFFQLIRPLNLYVRTQKRTTFPSKSEGAR